MGFQFFNLSILYVCKGAQIIDMMLLVIDAQKGIQTQTAECIILGEILRRKLLVVVNKVDLWAEPERADKLKKLKAKLQKTLAKTAFGDHVAIYDVAALTGLHVKVCSEFHLYFMQWFNKSTDF